MDKSQHFKLPKTLKQVGNWLIADKVAKVVITNPFPEMATHLKDALGGFEDNPSIINNPR